MNSVKRIPRTRTDKLAKILNFDPNKEFNVKEIQDLFRKHCYRKYITSTNEIGEILPLKDYKRIESHSPSIQFNNDGILEDLDSQKEHFKDLMGDHADLFLRFIKNFNLELKAHIIDTRISGYSDNNGRKIYVCNYILYRGSGYLYNQYESDKRHDLMTNQNRGVIVISTSKETDNDANKAAAFLLRIGVLNVNVGLFEQNPQKNPGLHKEEEIELLKEQVEELDNQVIVAKERGKTAQTRVGQLKAVIDGHEDEIDDLKEKLNTLYSTKRELDEKTKKLEDRKKELDQTRTDYNDAVKRKDNLESAMKKALQELADPGFRKKKAIEGAKKELNDSLNSLF